MKTNIAMVAGILSSFETVKPNLRVALVGEKNLAPGAIKRKIAIAGDAYMVCKAVISEEGGQLTQATITEALAEKWGVTKDQLLEAALQSTMKEREPVMNGLQEMTGGLLGIPQEGSPAIYVLTNTQMIEGAACICYTGLLEEIRGKIGCDGFWILPSSIHEVLIVPGEWSLQMALEYGEMVKSINEAVVTDKEVLSDKPMYYENGKIYAY